MCFGQSVGQVYSKRLLCSEKAGEAVKLHSTVIIQQKWEYKLQSLACFSFKLHSLKKKKKIVRTLLLQGCTLPSLVVNITD